MQIAVETIATHTGTTTGSSFSLAADGKQNGGIADLTRHFHVTGIAGGSIIKLQGSMDNSNFVDWITGINADGWYIVEDGPLYMRSVCTTFGTGSVVVKQQKFLEE